MANNNISILYEDSTCAVVNKPAGILTHAVNKKDKSVTLAQWWAKKANLSNKTWCEPSRAGIVHRLDRDTSGAIVLAKNATALVKLQNQFRNRTLEKKYIALVSGVPAETRGVICTKIARSKKRRTKKTSSFLGLTSDAREAISEYELIKKIDKNISLMQFTIKTGRTHQVRLHAKTIGTPILGDQDYNTKISRKISLDYNINRQMLHALLLRFESPQKKANISVIAPLPSDMGKFLPAPVKKKLEHKVKDDGKIFILTGPSGVGKGSVASALVEENLSLEWIKTLTSRPQRPDDRAKSRRFFVSKDKFKKMLNEGEILEYNIYNNNYYGTPRYAISDALKKGKHPLLDIDVNGARAIKKIYNKQVVVIFLKATKDEIVTRLHKRKMPDKVINQRLAIRQKEIRSEENFDYLVHNKQNKLPDTVSRIKKIILREL